MKNIFFRDGILIYYGNPAGYLSEGKVVLDSIFDKEEIIAFLSEKEKLAVEIRSGVYDRLSEGGGMEMTVEDLGCLLYGWSREDCEVHPYE